MAGINGVITKGTYQLKTPLDGVTSTTTSSEIVVAGAKRITWFFTRADHTSGSTVFDVNVSLNGTTYVDFNMLVSNLANTNGQNLTRVASVTLASNTTESYSMELEHGGYYSLQVTATETTDGTHTAQCLIEW